ncbi:hypothetical protein BH23GEM3_BH23GEM3_22170 [soil metagenome]
MRRILGLTLALTLAGTASLHADLVASLRGSPAAMVQQNEVAKSHGLAFYGTAGDIRAAVASGELVELAGNEDYAVADFVQYPFLQPAGLVFVERLSAQYRESCGQKLVVTSATRPTSGQPVNAHRLSVHPAGMAVDLRVSDRASCRSWLESTLLSLEERGVLNGIREFRPPHYHVAVFPEPYLAYVEEIQSAEEAALAAAVAAEEQVTESVQAVLRETAVASSFLAVDGETQAPASPAPAPWLAAVALVFALPFGIGFLVRRRRRE